MGREERDRWNRRYLAGEHCSPEPSSLITGLSALIPRSGRAIDVAGGTGRHGLWLARHGLDVTVADLSEVALEIAQRHATQSGLTIRTLQVDIEREPFPDGPWDVILVVHYLWRPLFELARQTLAAGGMLIYLQPTMSNLSRHEKPSAQFLLEDGEMLKLVSGFKLLHHQEGWLSEGRHEALVVAQNVSA